MNPHSVRGARSGASSGGSGNKESGKEGSAGTSMGDRGDKRARILESALRVFASKGFFGAKVSDVAEEAGVADGTIYLYFKSKDDLLICLFEEQMSQVNGALEQAIASSAEPS